MNYLLKGGMLFFQIASLGLLTEFLSINNLSIYFTIVSMGSILLVFTDFGFIRYAFKLFAEGQKLTAIICQTIHILILGLLVAIPIFYFWSYYKGYSAYWIFCVVISIILSKMNNINRYVFINNNKVSGSIAIEGFQPIFFSLFSLTGFSFAKMFSNEHIDFFSLNWLFTYYCLSFIGAFFLSIIFNRTKKTWFESLSLLYPLSFKVVFGNIKASFPVSIEAALSMIWFNLLVVISNSFFTDHATAIIGFFQRVLNFARAFVSVSVSMNLKKFYMTRLEKNFFYSLIVITGCIFLFSWITLFVFIKMFSQIWDFQLLELFRQISVYPISASLCFSLLYAFFNLSFAALGANMRYLRIVSVLNAIFFLLIIHMFFIVIYKLSGTYGTWSFVEISIFAMGTALAMASLVLSYGLYFFQNKYNRVKE